MDAAAAARHKLPRCAVSSFYFSLMLAILSFLVLLLLSVNDLTGETSGFLNNTLKLYCDVIPDSNVTFCS